MKWIHSLARSTVSLCACWDLRAIELHTTAVVVSLESNATPLRFYYPICDSLRTETVKTITRLSWNWFFFLWIQMCTNKFINRFPFVSFFFSFGADTVSDKSDQSTAETWWRSHITTPGADVPLDNSNYFSATHGLVQTHPSLSGGIPRPPLSASTIRSGGNVNPAILSATASQNPKSPYRHLDFASSATAELRRNPSLSAPDECARACREGEPPRICYYHFTLEYYTVLGA